MVRQCRWINFWSTSILNSGQMEVCMVKHHVWWVENLFKSTHEVRSCRVEFWCLLPQAAWISKQMRRIISRLSHCFWWEWKVFQQKLLQVRVCIRGRRLSHPLGRSWAIQPCVTGQKKGRKWFRVSFNSQPDEVKSCFPQVSGQNLERRNFSGLK